MSEPISAVSLDSTSVKVHPGVAGTLKNGKQASGRSRGGLNTKIHMTVSSETCAVGFILLGGEVGDASEGRLLLDTIGRISEPCGAPVFLLWDHACEDWQTRWLAFPLKKNWKHSRKYDKELYKRRNEVERMFRRLKTFRRIATRYGKLDLMFSVFIYACLMYYYQLFIGFPLREHALDWVYFMR